MPPRINRSVTGTHACSLFFPRKREASTDIARLIAMNTVPKNLTPALMTFCREISSERAVFIHSKPSSDAQHSACFDNVARKIARAGGQTAYGWAIWHVPGLYFEAEHHGVWRNRQGALLDVSPQLEQVPRILFLPDTTAIYDPKNFRANIFKAANDGPLASEFVLLARARNDIINRYRNDEYVTVRISDADKMKIGCIDLRLQQLLSLNAVNTFIHSTN